MSDSTHTPRTDAVVENILDDGIPPQGRLHSLCAELEHELIATRQEIIAIAKRWPGNEGVNYETTTTESLLLLIAESADASLEALGAPRKVIEGGHAPAPISDGGPAFPRFHISEEKDGERTVEVYGGMTLRDHFAAKAMQGMLAHSTRYQPRPEAPRNWHEAISEEAYQIANAMIYARRVRS